MYHINPTMRLLLFLPLIALFACDSVQKTEEKVIEKTKLTIQNLTKLNLPFSSKCGENLKVYDKDSIRNIFSDLPDNLKFGGLLKKTKTITAIILLDTHADSQIHYLFTLNDKGEILEKFKLFAEDCGEDEFYKTQSNYIIDRNLKITQTDNSETYKRTEEGEIIDSSIVKTSHKYEFYIDTKGKIKQYGT